MENICECLIHGLGIFLAQPWRRSTSDTSSTHNRVRMISGVSHSLTLMHILTFFRLYPYSYNISHNHWTGRIVNAYVWLESSKKGRSENAWNRRKYRRILGAIHLWRDMPHSHDQVFPRACMIAVNCLLTHSRILSSSVHSNHHMHDPTCDCCLDTNADYNHYKLPSICDFSVRGYRNAKENLIKRESTAVQSNPILRPEVLESYAASVSNVTAL